MFLLLIALALNAVITNAQTQQIKTSLPVACRKGLQELSKSIEGKWILKLSNEGGSASQKMVLICDDSQHAAIQVEETTPKRGTKYSVFVTHPNHWDFSLERKQPDSKDWFIESIAGPDEGSNPQYRFQMAKSWVLADRAVRGEPILEFLDRSQIVSVKTLDNGNLEVVFESIQGLDGKAPQNIFLLSKTIGTLELDSLSWTINNLNLESSEMATEDRAGRSFTLNSKIQKSDGITTILESRSGYDPESITVSREELKSIDYNMFRLPFYGLPEPPYVGKESTNSIWKWFIIFLLLTISTYVVYRFVLSKRTNAHQS